MSTHRQYELVYIVPGETAEQPLADLQSQVEAIVARFSGTVDKVENWGRRKLAYEIGPHKEGVYVLLVFSGPGDLVKEIDRRLKVIDLVIRHLIVRVDEENEVADRRQARRKAQTARRRVARGLPPEPEERAEGTPAEPNHEQAEV